MRDDAVEKKSALVIALAGNPNAGKTTLFNALTGAHHKVGNYPGVTVEKREGRTLRDGREYRVVDLPGMYSLSAYSLDEVAARDFLLGEAPDLVIDVLDSTNLERGLSLCSQLQELGLPVVGALNMSDEAKAKGIKIDEKALSDIMGMPFVKTVGTKGEGLELLLTSAADIVDCRPTRARKTVSYGADLERALEPITRRIAGDAAFAARYPARWLAVKLLEKDGAARGLLAAHREAGEIAAMAEETGAWIQERFSQDAEILFSERRSACVRDATKKALGAAKPRGVSLTDRVDSVVMNRFLAFPIFAAVLWALFKLTFALGEYPMAWLELLFGRLSGLALSALPPGLPRSLVVDGIIAGVGSVFSFVPLIVILFFFLSLLEDSGYMARAAFATDRLLQGFGLHGQSVFPMMLGFGCSVPAIMAARTLKSRRDRVVTTLVIPFMSCGAKMPVFVLFAGAFFPNRSAEIVMVIYAIGVLLALAVAWLLRKTVVRGEAAPFVLELPPWRAPTLRGLAWQVREKTWHYVKKAGTVILLASIFIWAVTSLPARELSLKERVELAAAYRAERPWASDADIELLVEAAAAEYALSRSAAGGIGSFLEPFFRPLGFGWKLGVASLTGFAAKEVVVSTLGVLYRVGPEADHESEGLRAALRGDPGFTPLAAFVFMLFTLMIPPCFAALATMKAELGSRWAAFAFAFLSSLGWLVCFAVFQAASALGLG